MKWVVSDVKGKLKPSNVKKKIKNQEKNIRKGLNTFLNTFKKKEDALIKNSANKKFQNRVPFKTAKVKQLLAKNIRTSTPQAQLLLTSPKKINKNNASSLRERMLNKLKAARFRYLNEQLYLTNGKAAYQLFNEDPESFEAYHTGFRQQITQWPINPLDIIIKSLRNKCADMVIADFGCGEAKLAASLESATVYSFDLVALNDRVTVCDMKRTPLPAASVDVAVFCLSLMGTNLSDFIKEANRVLKEGGILKIAEVESRFENVNQFIQGVEKFGFKVKVQDLSHNLFYFLDFQKESNISKRKKRKLPHLELKPCLYKKR